jgi:aspartate/methionine/tyrosine aminotransferase
MGGCARANYKCHPQDFLTVGAPAPLQEAGAAALGLPPEYYAKLAENYRLRRDHLVPALEAAGFKCFLPRGAYYVMTDISAYGFGSDVEFVNYLVKEIGIAAVPGSSFYRDAMDGAQQVRFAFCKKLETLDAAAKQFKVEQVAPEMITWVHEWAMFTVHSREYTAGKFEILSGNKQIWHWKRQSR